MHNIRATQIFCRKTFRTFHRLGLLEEVPMYSTTPTNDESIEDFAKMYFEVTFLGALSTRGGGGVDLFMYGAYFNNKMIVHLSVITVILCELLDSFDFNCSQIEILA
ncbi:hypothetical protein ACJX0J_034562, partial [Zea mays]